MKIRFKGNWNFIRVLRLFLGVTGTIQGIMMEEFTLSLAGFFLVYMAIANVDAVALMYVK
jgi:hypothetical protein